MIFPQLVTVLLTITCPPGFLSEAPSSSGPGSFAFGVLSPDILSLASFAWLAQSCLSGHDSASLPHHHQTQQTVQSQLHFTCILSHSMSLPSKVTLSPYLYNYFMAESEELKSLLMKVKEESEKCWLNTQHSEN